MPPSMDKSQNAPAPPAGYETRDANVRGVFSFLVVLTVVLVLTFIVCWGLFRYLSAQPEEPASISPFAETRQLPLGPQLQVNPRQDLLQYRDEQEKSLESYGWENRSAGTVRVPIEQAMELLLRKGVSVQNAAPPADTVKPASKGAARP
jgi:hypothetical protein